MKASLCNCFLGNIPETNKPRIARVCHAGYKNSPQAILFFRHASVAFELPLNNVYDYRMRYVFSCSECSFRLDRWADMPEVGGSLTLRLGRADRAAGFGHLPAEIFDSVRSRIEAFMSVFGRPEGEFDFDGAIAAHVKWKERLTCYLESGDRSLDPVEVARDCRCDLGKWIYGKGRRYSGWPEYAELKSEHATFHVAAASIVARANADHEMMLALVFDGESEYARSSDAVITAILAMKAKACTKA